LGAVDVLGAVVLSAIQWDQQVTVNRAIRLEIPHLAQRLESMAEHGQQVRGGDAIEEIPNVVVTGDLVHPKQALRITVPFAFVHGPLESQKRRTLGEEHRECAEAGIFDEVAGVVPGAFVRQLAEQLPEPAHQRVKGHRVQTLFEWKTDALMPVLRSTSSFCT